MGQVSNDRRLAYSDVKIKRDSKKGRCRVSGPCRLIYRYTSAMLLTRWRKGWTGPYTVIRQTGARRRETLICRHTSEGRRNPRRRWRSGSPGMWSDWPSPGGRSLCYLFTQNTAGQSDRPIDQRTCVFLLIYTIVKIFPVWQFLRIALQRKFCRALNTK